MSGPAPSPLGAFAKLPAEIRCEIWNHFMPDSRVVSSPLDYYYPHRFEVLRTSQQIYDEVCAMLYDREICFCVDATTTVASSGGLRFFLPSYYEAEGLPGEFRDIRSVAWKFSRVRFEIRAPRLLNYDEIFPSNLLAILLTLFHLSWGGFQKDRHRSANLPEVGIVFNEPREPLTQGTEEAKQAYSLSNPRWTLRQYILVLQHIIHPGHLKGVEMQLHKVSIRHLLAGKGGAGIYFRCIRAQGRPFPKTLSFEQLRIDLKRIHQGSSEMFPISVVDPTVDQKIPTYFWRWDQVIQSGLHLGELTEGKGRDCDGITL